MPISQTHVGNDQLFAGWSDSAATGDQEAWNNWCRSYLEELRWPDGISCPRCASAAVARVSSRNQIDCRACRYRFSVGSGTLFQNSNVPLWKWLVAVSLLIGSADGFPAHRLAEAIGVSYKTAWSMGHRIRAGLGGSGVVAAPSSGSSAGRRLYDRSIAGRYHQVSIKHLPAYLAEREWRARNHENPDAFRDALLALLHAGPPSPRRA